MAGAGVARQGYTRKGKKFYEHDSSQTEDITALQVGGAGLHTSRLCNPLVAAALSAFLRRGWGSAAQNRSELASEDNLEQFRPGPSCSKPF
jgi:hypothetical protein